MSDDDDNDESGGNMSGAWEAQDGNAIYIKGERIPIDGQITAEKVREVARAKGVLRFFPEDANGDILPPTSFPRDGVVNVVERIKNA